MIKRMMGMLILAAMLCMVSNVSAQSSDLTLYYQYRNTDHKKAMTHLERAAKQGDPYAMYELGMENSEEERFYWLEYAAMDGVTAAMLQLYREYQDIDLETATLFLEDAAQAGDAEAMFELAKVYMWGNEVRQANNAKAKHWLDKAVEERWEPAWYHAAYAYEHGLYGYERSDKKAVGCYLMLWELGGGLDTWEYGEGLFNLACMLEEGRGREKDDEFAFELYAQAHEHLWDCKALLKMAAMYAQGRGTARNTQKAWDILDSLREDAPGYEGDWAYLMGMMYEKGYGVQKNQTLAKAYYAQAQEYGCMLEW